MHEVMGATAGQRKKMKSVRHIRSFGYRALLLLVLGLGLLIIGCKDGAITWSDEARSPGGRWIATARSQQWGGPGTAYDATTVYLKRVDDPQPPTQVITFSHQYSTMKLKMAWLSPTHLDVTYGPSDRPGDRVKLDFNVAKHDEIEISVQEIGNTSGPPAASAH